MAEDLLSAAQAAAYLGLTRARINQLAEQGRLSRTEIGGYFLYRRADLDAYKAAPKSKGGRPKEAAEPQAPPSSA